MPMDRPSPTANSTCFVVWWNGLAPTQIGLSVTTPLRKRNVRVTRFIKTFTNAPVIWGGYDPTVNTADCLEFCDYACVGEGDVTMIEIARRLDAAESLDD